MALKLRVHLCSGELVQYLSPACLWPPVLEHIVWWLFDSIPYDLGCCNQCCLSLRPRKPRVPVGPVREGTTPRSARVPSLAQNQNTITNTTSRSYDRMFEAIVVDKAAPVLLPGVCSRHPRGQCPVTFDIIMFLSLIHISEPTRPY